MSMFDDAFKQIKNSQNKEYNCLSWAEIFPKFSTVIPGISRETYYAITGAPGSAKTQMTDFAFLYHAINFAEKHKLDLEIVYFSLEISKKAKIIQGIAKRLFEAEGLRWNSNILLKVGNNGLSEDQLGKVEKVDKYFQLVEKYVTFYDEALTPSQIYRIQEEKMRSCGDYDRIRNIYIPGNPEKYTIFITDHISLIVPDPGQTLHSALATFSRNNLIMKNTFGATVVNIHQQGVDGQVQQFTSKGDNIAAKLEPKLAGLADNRTLGRDYDVVIGLFSPKAHDIDFHKGYKTKLFGDKCRFMSVIKNRQGPQDNLVGLYFDGAVGYFEELPKPDEFTIISNGQKIENTELYEKYMKGHVGPLNPGRSRLFNF